MKKLFFMCLLAAMITFAGCIGCGGNKEFVKEDEQVESEEEKIKRIASDVFMQMESERQQLEAIKHKSIEQTQTIPSPVMQKPAVMMPTKKEFGVESVDKSNRVVVFEADSSMVAKLNVGQFGHVRQLSIIDGSNRWQLKVSARYDFDEVANYLKNLQ
jgi:hypothetical protein